MKQIKIRFFPILHKGEHCLSKPFVCTKTGKLIGSYLLTVRKLRAGHLVRRVHCNRCNALLKEKELYAAGTVAGKAFCLECVKPL